MPAAHPSLPDRALIEPLFRAIKHVFETNLVRKTEMAGILTYEKLDQILGENASDFVISAILCGGGINCTISLLSPNGLNFAYSRDYLDVDESMLQLGAEIPVYRDAAGEINNMLAGSFRNMLSKGNLHLSLTPPTILDGPKSLITALSRSKSYIVAEIKVEEFNVFVCLWTS